MVMLRSAIEVMQSAMAVLQSAIAVLQSAMVVLQSAIVVLQSVIVVLWLWVRVERRRLGWQNETAVCFCHVEPHITTSAPTLSCQHCQYILTGPTRLSGQHYSVANTTQWPTLLSDWGCAMPARASAAVLLALRRGGDARCWHS